MIVHLMGLGQRTMESEQLLELNKIGEAVEQAIKAGNQEQLRRELQRLVEAVRSNDQEVSDDLTVEPGLVLSDTDIILEGIRKLFGSTSGYYGLIPDPEVDLESVQNE